MSVTLLINQSDMLNGAMNECHLLLFPSYGRASCDSVDLCEEMEHLYVYIMPRWEDERNAFQEVLQAFNDILKDEESRHYEEQFVIRLSISEATKRIYAGD